MRDKSLSKQGRSRKRGPPMDVEKIDKLKDEQPQLSGAYIRSLVKQLVSSKTKDPSLDDGDKVQENRSRIRNCVSEQPQQPLEQPAQHKKQVRRRLHTRRPYQERLINMAEARREIATALKFHRASMRKQGTNCHHIQSPGQPPLMPPPQGPQYRNLDPSNTTTSPRNICSNQLNPYSAFYFPPAHPFFWPLPAFAPPPPLEIPENFDLALPSQTLGLNLNFQDFDDLDTTLYHSPLSIHSSTSSSSSMPSTFSSPTLPAATEEVVPILEEATASSSSNSITNGNLEDTGGEGGLHQAMDYEEREEIRTLGEQHQVEWNDTLNLVTSDKWFKFLKSMETGAWDEDKVGHEEHGDDYFPFDALMEYPPWLDTANERCSLQPLLVDHFSDDYVRDSALPCMDIDEIEGMAGEWLT